MHSRSSGAAVPEKYDLWSWERWVAIAKMNTGAYDALIDKEFYQDFDG